MQPIYHENEFKLNARKENVDIFRRVMGLDRIPSDREYWTLCNYQPQTEGAEIVQMERLGLINSTQFHGVDRAEHIISQNRAWHPNAHWHHGEWIDVIESSDFNPAMIYLDMTSFTDHWIATGIATRTMMACPSGTLLLINTMMNDPRSRRVFDPTTIVSNMPNKVPPSELKQWDTKIENYMYSATGKTDLITHILHKR